MDESLEIVEEGSVSGETRGGGPNTTDNGSASTGTQEF